MFTQFHRLVLTAVLCCAFAPFAWAQDAHEGHGDADEQAKMMEIFAKYAQPGEQHATLKNMVGSWDYTSKFWMDPSAEPMVDNGTCENKLVHDGRYVLQSVKGMAMGMPFTGTGIAGYDRYNDEFFSFWFDNMSTGYMLTHGQKKGDTIVFEGTYDDVWMDQKDKWHKMTVTENGPDKHTMAMFTKGPDGNEMKAMEIVYTRSKMASN